MGVRLLGLNSVLMVSLLTLPGCAGRGTRPSDVVFRQDVQVRRAGGALESLKKGETFALNGEPVFVESPGHVGLLIVPDGPEGDSQVGRVRAEVQLRPLAEWDVLANSSDRKMNEILFVVSDVYRLLSQRQGREALSKVERLQRENPGLVFLQLLKSSCLLVLGDRAAAVLALEEALVEFPREPSARQLYRTLTGDEFRPASSRSPAEKSKRKVAP